VLMVGMEPADNSPQLANLFSIPVGTDRFIQPENFHLYKNRTSRQGVFVAGCASGPKSIGETLADARSVAFEVYNFFNNN
jgi:heterodisulfide reductase subunit A